MNYDRSSASIQPQYVIETLSRITRGQAVITTGVGQHQMWAAQYYAFQNPRSLLTSGSMGTMGFGLPAAIPMTGRHFLPGLALLKLACHRRQKSTYRLFIAPEKNPGSRFMAAD